MMSVSKQKTQVDGRLEDGSMCQLSAGGLKLDGLALGMERESTASGETVGCGG